MFFSTLLYAFESNFTVSILLIKPATKCCKVLGKLVKGTKQGKKEVPCNQKKRNNNRKFNAYLFKHGKRSGWRHSKVPIGVTS